MTILRFRDNRHREARFLAVRPARHLDNTSASGQRASLLAEELIFPRPDQILAALDRDTVDGVSSDKFV
jgi:hypothetical protein